MPLPGGGHVRFWRRRAVCLPAAVQKACAALPGLHEETAHIVALTAKRGWVQVIMVMGSWAMGPTLIAGPPPSSRAATPSHRSHLACI